MKHITITISGESRTGKSHLTHMIKHQLDIFNFDVTIDKAERQDTLETVDLLMQLDLVNRLKHISKETKILITTVHTPPTN